MLKGSPLEDFLFLTLSVKIREICG